MNKKVTVFVYYVGLIIFMIALLPFSQSLSASSVDQLKLNQDGQTLNNTINNNSPDTNSLDQSNQANDVVVQDMHVEQQDQIGVLIAGLIMLVSGIIALIIWIRTLIGLAQVQEWNWFFGILIAGAIVMFVYLKSGPQLLKNKGVSSAVVAYPQSPRVPSGYPATSAWEILQQRYARGEIDSATYEEMAARLKSSHLP